MLPGGNRYVSSVYSRERLYHRAGSDCPYYVSIHPGNRVAFRSRVKAEEKGLHFCSLCRHRVQQKTLRDYT